MYVYVFKDNADAMMWSEEQHPSWVSGPSFVLPHPSSFLSALPSPQQMIGQGGWRTFLAPSRFWVTSLVADASSGSPAAASGSSSMAPGLTWLR